MIGPDRCASLRIAEFVLLSASVWAAAPSPAQERKDSPYEITAHRATLHLFPGQNAVACADTLSIRLNGGRTDHISLRLLSVFEVEQVTVNDRNTRHKRDGDSLRLEGLPRDTLLRVLIRYSGILAFRSELSRLTPDRAVLLEDEIFPHGNSALEYARLSIEVPHDWEAYGAGRMVRRESLNDSVIYTLETDRRVPLLGWICAGIYRSMRSDSSGVPVSVHLFPEDSASGPAILSLAVDAIRFYGFRFSPYRFSNLEIVEVEDWVGGGNVLAVAIPNVVMIKRTTLHTDDRFNQARAVLPHEVAHQWWPMTVFVDDVDAALLSEGMCDYSALLFNESKGRLSIRD